MPWVEVFGMGILDNIISQNGYQVVVRNPEPVGDLTDRDQPVRTGREVHQHPERVVRLEVETHGRS